MPDALQIRPSKPEDAAHPLVTGVSSPSGGGKTAVTRRIAELLPDAVALFFDDYDFDTRHPESFRKWLEDGADYNAWKTPALRNDLRRLKAGESIVSPVDGSRITPKAHLIFDAPLGYTHTETGVLIDFMVFIDTPLDVAMARRLLRDFCPRTGKIAADLQAEMTVYLDYGRRAYLEMERQIKPACDLVVNGCRSIDEIAGEITERIKSFQPIR